MKQDMETAHFYHSLVFRLLASVLVILLIIFSAGYIINIQIARNNLYQQRDIQIQAQRETLAQEIRIAQQKQIHALEEQLKILAHSVKGPLINHISTIQDTSDYIEQQVIKRFQSCFQQNTSQTTFECLKMYSSHFTLNTIRIVNRLMIQTNIQLLLSRGDILAVEILDWEGKFFDGFFLNDAGEISHIQQDSVINPNLLSLSKDIFDDEYLGKITFYYDQRLLANIHERAEQDILAFTAYTEQQVATSIQQITQSRIIEASIFFVTSLLAISLIVIFTIIRPLLILKRQAEKLATGDFSHQVPYLIKRHDELGDLAQAFQVMSTNIQQYYQQLQHANAHLEKKVQERTQELELKNQQLALLSITDKLTQIYNRVKLEDVFHYQMTLASRYQHPFSLLICDIDFFKRINDTYGHAIGDKVLVETARILQKTLRDVDILGRWGGEEFLILCPETDQASAVALAERLRCAIAEHTFSYLDFGPTISIGVSTFRATDTQENLLERADQALYRAKAAGRNCVCVES